MLQFCLQIDPSYNSYSYDRTGIKIQVALRLGSASIFSAFSFLDTFINGHKSARVLSSSARLKRKSRSEGGHFPAQCQFSCGSPNVFTRLCPSTVIVKGARKTLNIERQERVLFDRKCHFLRI